MKKTKRQPKKLVINKQMLRELVSDDLRGVAGALRSLAPSCAAGCGPSAGSY
jgi:hypothetical protein